MSDTRKSPLFPRLLSNALLLAMACWTSASAAQAADAVKIVQEADLARGGGLKGGLQVTTVVTNHRKARNGRSYTLDVQSKGGNSLVTFTDPPNSRGTRILMRERNMWFMSPNARQAVPISPRQRLLGEAANGDITTTDFARDYQPTLRDGSVEVNGEACHVIDLEAKVADATYERITYYVSVKERTGVRAEYKAKSGKLLKVADFEYDNTIEEDGKLSRFVSRTVIRNALDSEEYTELTYRDPSAKAIRSSAFDLRSLMNK